VTTNKQKGSAKAKITELSLCYTYPDQPTQLSTLNNRSVISEGYS